MSGGGAVALGSSITLTNAGVTSNVAGTGITVSGGTGAVTITNSDRGSSQNIFKNIAVSGQTTVVADGNDDTLTLAGAGATTITTDATTDTITISSVNTTYSVGDGGLTAVNFTTTRRDKLDGIAANANNYSLPTATSTALGGIELASDTAQTVAANAVSSTASRTYGLQLNAALQGVVNVPWTDTTYSVGDGGLTAVNFTTTRRDKLDGIAAGATNVTNTNQLTNGAGYITASSSDTLTNKAGNISQWTNNSGYITSSGTAAKVENTVGGSSAVDLVYGNMADNDQFRIRIGGTASNSGFVEIATADDAAEPIYARQYSGVFTTLSRTAAILDGSGNTTFPGDVTAYSSDERLKENVQNIPNALDKVLSLNGVTFDWKQEAFDAGFNPKIKEGDAGVLAQQVQAVLPQAVKPAPFDIDENGGSISGKDYLTVQYEKLAPLFIEAIKEQQKQIQELKAELEELKNK